MIKLYELAGAEDNRRFSPFCWRVRFALLHKGLLFESIPWRFTEKEAIAFSGQGKVPVIVDGETVIYDSWAIAEYLEETYTDRPLLFGGESSKALSRFVTDWVETVLHPGIFRLTLTDIYAHLHPVDKDYFRKTREQWLGMKLEEVCANRNNDVLSFRNSLAPLRATLQRQSFLAGSEAAWADYVTFSAFQWSRCISSFPLLEAKDPIVSWCDQMLNLFDGEANKASSWNI
ncbi:MAG: glutathione S-transferase family protein [Scytonematopsis contorta HA4267-MV1]|jgi:glutathione S-transferase|nr:glutathione S-transferase family protein [Scytonematopsis contorta HA4267-MV1]